MIETAPRRATPPVTPPLSTVRGAALYIGALLGPGLLLLPGLAVTVAGPASLLAWVALLVLSALFAVVFAAFGLRFPSAGGVIGYVTAGLGPRAGLAAGWCFLAGVVAGAPVVCLIGASYVTELTGGGRLARAAVGALLLLVLLALARGGLRASAAAQLLLVGLLVGVVAVAVAGTAGSVRAANWTPFAPHGWFAVAHAAAILMLSFVGWEAVAPLTTAFADPARQLTRVVAIALAVTSALYLGLAIVTIGVLGPGAATIVPLAELLQRAIGPAGPAAAAVAAVVLTLGSVNAYISGGAVMAGHLTRRSGSEATRSGASGLGASGLGASGPGAPEGGRSAARAAVPGRGRGVRAAADHALRLRRGEPGRPGGDTDDALPRGLPGQHGLGRPRPARPRPLGGRPRLGGGDGHARLLRMGASAPRPDRGGLLRPVAQGCAAAVASSPDPRRTAAGSSPVRPGATTFSSSRVVTSPSGTRT